MFEPGETLAARTADIAEVVAIASSYLDTAGVSGFPAVMQVLDASGQIAPASITPLLIKMTNNLVRAFRQNPGSPEAYAALAHIRADLAATMFDLTLEAMFGDGPRDIAALNDVASVCLIGLLSMAGAHDQAGLLVAETRKLGNTPALARMAWFARCRATGSDMTLASCFTDRIPEFETPDVARSRIDEAPLHIAAHRALLRFRLVEHEFGQACDALAVALALPTNDREKSCLAPDLAVLAAAMAARGELSILQENRMRWAMASSPGIVQAAASTLEHAAGTGRFSFLQPEEAENAVVMLREFGRAAPVTGFPMRNGKPHVDIVWLEITNHCNQKCTFCPDMFREDARTWLPLEQVKALIDQLAETISVGSMQLNAYGEPLLHPNIAEILAYIRERELPWPTFFTSHGMTLVDKKLKQLSGNYPSGIAISLHNDSQASYEKTRSQKIGDYETLVSRVSALMRQMMLERAPTHLRLYQMVSNDNVDLRVDEVTRNAFPDSPERMREHVRKWEAIAAELAAAAPADARAKAHFNSDEAIARTFADASHGDGEHLPILSWTDQAGRTQTAFMSARPVGTYANLLLEYDPRWNVSRKLVSQHTCGFTNMPSLAIFASGKLGICCLDLNSTATFGSLSDFGNLRDALTSPQALRMFAQLSNGIATSRGCQICLGGTERLCGSNNAARPIRPTGHFREGI